MKNLLLPILFLANSILAQTLPSGAQGTKGFPVPDNVPVPIFTVHLPVANTGCSVVTNFVFTASNGVSTVSHTGNHHWAFVNQNGVLSGAGAESGEAVAGAGCPAACDTLSVALRPANRLAARVTFDNTLSVTGFMTYRIISDTCGTVVDLR